MGNQDINIKYEFFFLWTERRYALFIFGLMKRLEEGKADVSESYRSIVHSTIVNLAGTITYNTFTE
jgi:hypothetical protein